MKFEKAIAAALEPLIDVIAKMDARLRTLEVPNEIEVPIDDVAAALKADDEFCAMVKGEPGNSPEPVTLDEQAIIDALALRIPEPIPGAAGIGKDGTNGVDGIGHNVKQWLPGVYREGSIVQHDMGRIARAKCDTAEQPGTGDDWERIGRGGFRWRGVKSETALYEDGDFYIDDGTTFLMCEGKAVMFCRKGRDGKAGKDAVNHPPPKNGDDGKPGRDGRDCTALIGELKIWSGVDIPEGYLLADGGMIPAGDQYDALRAMHGDTVPDFSNEFLINETPKGVFVATIIVRAFLA